MRHRTLAAILACFSLPLLALPAPSLAAGKNSPAKPPAKARPVTSPAKKVPGKMPVKKPPVKRGRGGTSRKPVVRRQPIVPWGWPKRLSIPRIGVKAAAVEDLAFKATNDLHAPYRWNDVAWYDRGPRPGDKGHAVIFGHLDSTCCPAVFYELKDLRRGDIVQITYRSGRTLSFRVIWETTYWNYQFPTRWTFANTTQRGLVLFTCTGVFHYDGTGYDHKTVIYARLILANGRLG